MDLTIRRAIPGDEHALAELNAFVQNAHVANSPERFKSTSSDEVAAWFGDLMAAGEAQTWLAEASGGPVGYALAFVQQRPEHVFCHARRWLEFDQICVRPDRQHEGVGRALVEHVVAAAREQGVREVELTCGCFNDGAQEAFLRLGFTPVTVRMGLSVPPAEGSAEDASH